MQTNQQNVSLEALVDEGIIQDRHVLVIDTARRTNCNNRVEACGRRHAY